MFPRGKKAITPIIAVILLLMMTVAAAGAAFFWLSRIQGQMSGGVESYQSEIFTTMASNVEVVDAMFDNQGADVNLTIWFQNTGNTKIPVDDSTTAPTTTWILKDPDQHVFCSTDWSGTNDAVTCLEGCGEDEEIDIGAIQKVILDLENNNCDINDSDAGLYYFTTFFSGKATSSGSFVKS